MGVRSGNFFFAIVLCLTSSCATLFNSSDSQRAAKLVSLPAAPEPNAANLLSPELAALAWQQDKQEADLFAPFVLPPSALPTQLAVTKPGRPVPTARPADESPTALQKAPGPRADDRLLELLEKDLDKAVGQSVERRPLQFSNAVIDDPKVRHFVDYFSKSSRGHFTHLLARSGKYMPMIAKALRDAGLPDELGYLALIESGFEPQTASPSGAAGLWQFVPVTARRYGLRIDSWVDERRDPVKSTRAAAAYLKDLHNYYGRWFLATAAYNAGQGALDLALQKSKDKDYRSLGENPQLSAETRNFVPKFVAVTLIAALPRKYGFENLRYEAPLEYEEVEVRESVKLETVAAMTGSDLRVIAELNPALIRGQTPPGEAGYRVNIPPGRGLLLAKAPAQKKDLVETTKEASETQLITHEVRRGETLFAIARRYGQNVRALMEINGLTTPKLQVGQVLQIWIESLRGALR